MIFKKSSLSKKEIKRIAYDTKMFYAYRNKITLKDLISIFDLLDDFSEVKPIVNVLQDCGKKYWFNNNEFQRAMLVNAGKKSQSRHKLDPFEQLAKFYRDYDIQVSDVVINTYIMSFSLLYTGTAISSIIEYLPPANLGIKTIKHLLVKVPKKYVDYMMMLKFYNMNPNLIGTKNGDKYLKQYMSDPRENVYINKPTLLDRQNCSVKEKVLDTLTADTSGYKTVVKNPVLFNYMRQFRTKSAEQIIQYLIDNQELEFLSECEKAYGEYNMILFSQQLYEYFVKACLQAQRPELVVKTPHLCDRQSNSQLTIQTIYTLFDKKQWDVILRDERILRYIKENDHDLIRRIPNKFIKLALCYVDRMYIDCLIGNANLPDADLEYTYLRRIVEHGFVVWCCVDFLYKYKNISDEMRTYMKIIFAENLTPDMFKDLTPRMIDLLIRSRCSNQIEWYKIMENLLIAFPKLPYCYIKLMLNYDSVAYPLVEQHWHSMLRYLIIAKKHIADIKQR